MKKIACILFNVMLAGIASCQEVRSVKVKITEEDGAPIEGVDATVTFLGYSGQTTQRVTGKTDALGVFEASGNPELRMSVRLEKEGYYETKSDRLSRKQDHDLTYVLRKIRNPIPLYARKFRGKLPSLGEKCGFDFEVGDWVAPHGQGRVGDIFINAKILMGNEKNPVGKVILSFPHEKEGLLAVNAKSGYKKSSELVMPHLAPKQDYIPTISRQETGYENKSKPYATSYFFRTRAKEIEPGKFIFNYAKFKEGFNFVMGGGRFLEDPYRKKYPKEYAQIEFTYYFNPAQNDRNLESDPERNLFKDLDSTEQVREP